MRFFIIYLLINSACVCIKAQILPPKEGKIKAFDSRTKQFIEISFKNDTAFGAFKVSDSFGKLLTNGIINNKICNYSLAKTVEYSDNGTHVFHRSYPLIEKNLIFKDTLSLLSYYYENSFKEKVNRYYSNGKPSSKAYYKLIKFNNYLEPIVKDTLYEFDLKGNVETKSYNVYINQTLIKQITISYFSSKKIKNFDCSFIDLENNNKYGSYYVFDKNGILTYSSNYFGSKNKTEVIYTRDKKQEIKSKINDYKNLEIIIDKKGNH